MNNLPAVGDTVRCTNSAYRLKRRKGKVLSVQDEQTFAGSTQSVTMPAYASVEFISPEKTSIVLQIDTTDLEKAK